MSRPPAPHLTDLPFLVVALGLGFQALLKRLHARTGRRENMAVGMGSIFFALCEEDGCIMKELATRLRMPKGTLSGLIARMERMGLIKRQPCPHDGRAQRVNLTRKARGMEAALRARHEHTLDVLQAGLNTAEVNELKRLLHHVLENLRADEKRPSRRTPKPARRRMAAAG
jgi:DNA-binding MarR family transcriptional regulator